MITIIISFFVICASFYAEYVLNYPPCDLCWMQRLLWLAIFLSALFHLSFDLRGCCRIINLNNGFIHRIFNAFRHLFPFSPRQGGRSALAFGSKRKNLLGRHLNLLLNKPIIQVIIFLLFMNCSVASYHALVQFKWIEDRCKTALHVTDLTQYGDLLKKKGCAEKSWEIANIPAPIFNGAISLCLIWLNVYRNNLKK